MASNSSPEDEKLLRLMGMGEMGLVMGGDQRGGGGAGGGGSNHHGEMMDPSSSSSASYGSGSHAPTATGGSSSQGDSSSSNPPSGRTITVRIAHIIPPPTRPCHPYSPCLSTIYPCMYVYIHTGSRCLKDHGLKKQDRSHGQSSYRVWI